MFDARGIEKGTSVFFFVLPGHLFAVRCVPRCVPRSMEGGKDIATPKQHEFIRIAIIAFKSHMMLRNRMNLWCSTTVWIYVAVVEPYDFVIFEHNNSNPYDIIWFWGCNIFSAYLMFEPCIPHCSAATLFEVPWGNVVSPIATPPATAKPPTLAPLQRCARSLWLKWPTLDCGRESLNLKRSMCFYNRNRLKDVLKLCANKHGHETFVWEWWRFYSDDVILTRLCISARNWNNLYKHICFDNFYSLQVIVRKKKTY